jgi:hypothetical protein
LSLLNRFGGVGAFLGFGLADAGLSSLAGFFASLYAARFLDTAGLGAYAICASGVMMAGLVPHHLLFLPAQIAALESTRSVRTALIRLTLGRGLLLSALTAPAAGLAGLLVSNQVPAGVLAPLGVTAAFLALVSTCQDNARSCFHLAGRPGLAALLSLAQLAITAAAILALHFGDAPAAWVPFGSLGLAGLASLALGLILAHRHRGPSPLLPPMSRLLRSGSSLLPAAVLPEAAILASSALLAALASASVLGGAEAARIIARPVQVLALGLGRSLGPRLMEAGHARSRPAALKDGLLYAASLLAGGGAFLLLAGWDHPLNPLAEALPAAYETQGLVALTIAVTLAGAIAGLPRAVLLGARLNAAVLGIAALGSGLRVAAVAVLALPAGAYALPLSQLVSGVVPGAWSVVVANRTLRR